MTVIQPTKNNVRPVLKNFQELNSHVMCHAGDDVTDVCDETLRERSLYYCGFEICIQGKN